MQAMIIFAVILISILAFSSVVPLSVQKAQVLQSQETSAQEDAPQAQTKKSESVSQTKIVVKSQKSKYQTPTPQPNFVIDTHIISGPKQGEIINDTNRVTFEFAAKVFPEETKGTIFFETKIEGFDKKWISSSAKKRTVVLPSGPKEYTFLVRAKLKNVIDPTPAKRTFKINLSPYFGKVRIASVQAKTSSRPSLIRLTTALKKEEEINITGWQIKGKRVSFAIPGGIERYYPGYNPTPAESIVAKQGDIIYLSGSSNPFGKGRNFRPNKCLGYFTNYLDFPIPLSRNCPILKREKISHLDPCCQEFILRMGRCETPNYSTNFRISRDSECVYFLNENFNYTSCFRKYSRDENFLINQWHVYMNRNLAVSNDCDTLYLRDRNGLFVDEYSYGRPVCNW